MDPICEITLCCKCSYLSLAIPISSPSSVEQQRRGPTNVGILYNPLDDFTAHRRLWSAFEVLCFIEHVAGKRILLFIMERRNLPYPLARDEPGPFNFWTFVMTCDDAHLLFDTLS